MDDRQLKHFDLPEPKTEAHFGIGQHIDLSQIMLEQTLLADSTVYGFTGRAAVAFAKATDEMLLDAIIQKAKEHGITDLYVLNEDFILAAIREKRERQPGVDFVPVVHGRWVDENEKPVPWDEYEPDAPKKSAYCSVCGEWLTASDEYPVTGRYCPNCGAKMDDPKGD